MTYYEKYHTLVDEITTKAINGVVPASYAMAFKILLKNGNLKYL